MKRYQRDNQTRRRIYNAMAIINNEQTTHKVYTNQNIKKRLGNTNSTQMVWSQYVCHNSVKFQRSFLQLKDKLTTTTFHHLSYRFGTVWLMIIQCIYIYISKYVFIQHTYTRFERCFQLNSYQIYQDYNSIIIITSLKGNFITIT